MKLLRKRLTPLLYGLALCLPLGLKLGVPLVLVQGERLGLFGSSSSDAVYTVDRVDGFMVTAHLPHQPPVQFQLAGLAESDERWQREATGILSMLLEASHNQVIITVAKPKQSSSPANALVQLPTGGYIQQILLSDGVAQLEPRQLDGMSAEIVQMLQQAELSAQAAHKNIWSQG
ncbi:hypothetical protein IQ273_07620 [Nodosilinea sp. LEGE 07298]|uniref:hypothetical protein n=1 Tax=Nodosilinea sp. LEGE 07298 TaxID=2777970 RepID=UPI001881E255|nr:hypothetical protein [Nodosilinea sp. LEGE 07298]MBE9109282.1 hypothetical protein [Nodosilinea sp. LEGE 07298]